MAEDDRQNIIFIMCDQMRGDCLGVDGHPAIETPHLDFLASRGTHFKHAYTPVPSCLPARAMIMSGQNQWHTGVLCMGLGQGPIPNDFPHTLAGELSNAGYQTQLVGKGHFHPQRHRMGFASAALDESGRLVDPSDPDEYRRWFNEQKLLDITPDDHGVNWNSWIGRPWHTEEQLHPTSWTMTRAIEFLKTRDKNRPFMLHISFARPHSPYVPPSDYFDMYLNRELPKAAVGDWADYHEDPDAAIDTDAWRGKQSDERIRRGRAGYYGEISFIDTQIGRLRNWVSRYAPELRGNTHYIFTSDHGDMVGDHHLWRKTYAYEGSARVPMIIHSPERAKRQVADEPVGLLDIMPTILDIAGVDIPNTVDGKSMMPLMQEADPEFRAYIHGEHCTCYHADQEMQYVTNGKRKYIWLRAQNEEQFFDLEADPLECRNLIDDAARAEEIAQWKEYLISELESRDCGWVTDGEFSAPEDGSALVSPYRDVRWDGTPLA